MASPADLAPIDSLAPGHPGRYDDGAVAVASTAGQGVLAHVLGGREPEVRTDRFALHRLGDREILLHDLPADAIDNDLAGEMAAVLGAAGLTDNDLFERLFVGVVLSTDPEPLAAWRAFYANTLRRLSAPDPGSGSIGELAPIYRRARTMVRGRTVLDVGSCFGFLPMQLADDGWAVTCSDLSTGAMRLLSRVDPRLDCVAADAAALPLAAGTADTVFAVHLLEHIDHRAGAAALAELLRVARCRVVVAVPYEDTPTAAYGHVRTVDRADLTAMGELACAAYPGASYEVLDADGGWLVVDL